MNVSVLASGSDGNAVWIESGETHVLVDAGTGIRQLEAALASVGRSLAEADAVLLTHDHSDHVKALAALERRRPVPLYATDGTIEAVCAAFGGVGGEDWPWTGIEAGCPFDIGAFRVEAFSVPHDAADPVGYVLSDGSRRIGIATDLGSVPASVRLRLHGCDALVLECNHDPAMLRESDRPWSLKQRIAGRSGHLSNDDAAELLAAAATPALRFFFPAHVSAECNSPDLAVGTARATLRSAGLDPDVVLPPVCPTPLASF